MPKPLLPEIRCSEAVLVRVMCDVTGLTKGILNACVFVNRLPVTLKSTDAIGARHHRGASRRLTTITLPHYI